MVAASASAGTEASRFSGSVGLHGTGTATLHGVRARLGATCALALGIAAAGLAQQQPTPPTFRETIDVNIVNVDVWVTDKKGRPVTGLSADDFRVREDGRQLELSNFFEYAAGIRVDAEKRSGEQDRGSGPGTQEPAFNEPPPPEQQLSLMVYIDNSALIPTARNRVLPFLRRFLRTQLGPHDRVMLVVLNQPPYEVVLPFTTESWRVAEATYELEALIGSRERTESERLDILREMNRDDADYYQVIGLVRNYAASVSAEVDMALTSVRDAVRTMAGLPGRKAMVYVSNGLAMRSAEDLFRAVEDRFSDSRGRWRTPGQARSRAGIDVTNASVEAYNYDASRWFEDLSSLANANRVTLYTISAQGTRIAGMRTADLRFSPSIEAAHGSNLQESLLYMADRTGGQAVVNTRNFTESFDRIASDFQNRYSLGFSSVHSRRGQSFPIDVELTREARDRLGFRPTLRYRDNWVNKPVSVEMGDRTLSALILGSTANPMGLRVEPVRGPGSREALDNGSVRSSLLALLPIGELTLLPAGDDHEARTRLWVQVLDEQGRASGVTEHEVPVLVKGADLEEALERLWPHALDVITSPGPVKVAVGLRDAFSAKTSVVTLALDVTDLPEPAPITATPGPASQPPETHEVLLARAADHYGHGRLDEMAAAARRVLQLTDDLRLTTRAYNLLGVALFDKPDRTAEDIAGAEDAFRRVISVMDNQSSLVPRYSLTRLLLDSGRRSEGIAEARGILAISAQGEIPDEARILLCHSKLPSPAPGAGSPGVDPGAPPPGQMIFKVTSRYTEDARSAGIEGTVSLRALIDAEGCVVDVAVIEGLTDGLTESAIAALERSVFHPAMDNGEPVAATYESETRFELSAPP